MNILLLNWRDPKNPLSGGAEYVTLEHCKAWIRHGHHVTWFSSSFDGSKAYETIEGVSVVRQGSTFWMFLFAWLYYILHRREFDLIIEQVHGVPFFAKLYARTPIIVFIHEVAGVIWDAMYPFPMSWLGKALERLYIRIYRGNCFWTDASSTKRELLTHGVPEKNCVVIPCPIRNTAIRALPRKRATPTFLFVGRIVRMKGIEDIVHAFGIILRSLPSATLWIVGGGELRYIQKLRDMVKCYGFEKHVVWWGKVDEKTKLRLMREAHMLLHASIKEGWGLVALEAASQGTPTVAYPSGGLTDTIIHGKTGVLTEAAHPQKLANEAILLYEDADAYAKLQKNGISWSMSFTWEDATSQSLALLSSMKP